MQHFSSSRRFGVGRTQHASPLEYASCLLAACSLHMACMLPAQIALPVVIMPSYCMHAARNRISFASLVSSERRECVSRLPAESASVAQLRCVRGRGVGMCMACDVLGPGDDYWVVEIWYRK
eukprot:765834-Hanusia_phi.AAC.2